ncbi:MAG: hypothetical protein JSS89_12095 [Bacteroidetes bacterium]|nr:hypothetical protein [Bacteroidota bacterium]
MSKRVDLNSQKLIPLLQPIAPESDASVSATKLHEKISELVMESCYQHGLYIREKHSEFLCSLFLSHGNQSDHYDRVKYLSMTEIVIENTKSKGTRSIKTWHQSPTLPQITHERYLMSCYRTIVVRLFEGYYTLEICPFRTTFPLVSAIIAVNDDTVDDDFIWTLLREMILYAHHHENALLSNQYDSNVLLVCKRKRTTGKPEWRSFFLDHSKPFPRHDRSPIGIDTFVLSDDSASSDHSLERPTKRTSAVLKPQAKSGRARKRTSRSVASKKATSNISASRNHAAES